MVCPRGAKVVLVFTVGLALGILLSQDHGTSATSAVSEAQTTRSTTNHKAPWLATIADDCANVYIDLGSNVGIQIRKLFEPDLYPGSTTLRVLTRTLEVVPIDA